MVNDLRAIKLTDEFAKELTKKQRSKLYQIALEMVVTALGYDDEIYRNTQNAGFSRTQLKKIAAYLQDRTEEKVNIPLNLPL